MTGTQSPSAVSGNLDLYSCDMVTSKAFETGGDCVELALAPWCTVTRRLFEEKAFLKRTEFSGGSFRV